MPTIEEAQDWYPKNDPVHGFDHIVRVTRTAEYLAQREGADLEITRAAALLHDAHGSSTVGGEQGRLEHHLLSAKFARQVLTVEDWPANRIAVVQHCIRAHRFRNKTEPPQSLQAKILFDADKLDVLGAIGIARTIAYDVTIGQSIYTEPSEQFLRTGQKEPGELHSSYHEYLYKLRKIKDLIHTPTAKSLAEERHRFLIRFFEQLAVEMRG